MIRDLGRKLYPDNCTDSWRRWVVTPARAVINKANDLGKGHPDIRFDFCHPPFASNTFDVVVYDPPYKLNGKPDADVDERYGVEFYSHVMHIVSNVVGTLSPDKDALDALFAGFPAGTVSGAPKVRACQIIAELEPERRGAYAGGVGYFSPDGSMDSCIVLRTAVVSG